ncbi:hypothetical protein DXV76_15140 [Rhodobacteraceae bacterium CCMM004]|nr:hypothetical protein DXV76_15140 [Rhodobacteraceae bacterium CCMM004]
MRSHPILNEDQPMTTRRTFLATSLALTATLAAPAAVAGDDGLYKDVFDPQSSFVRVLSSGPGVAAVDGTRIDDFTGGLSSYVNVMPGQVALTHSGGTTDLEIAPSTHYTVILRDGAAPEMLTDALQLNPAKSDVSLYNLSAAGGVDLFVPAARAVALKAVPVNGAKSVALKAPLTLDFDFRAGETTLASVAAVELKRRAGVSIVLTGADGGYAAVAVPNTYLR